MTTMTIRVDEDLKAGAAQVAEYYGFDLSTVTRAIWQQMVRTRSIPLDLNYPQPNAATLASIREGDEILASGGTGRSFQCGRDLLDAARA
ncbi:MAG: type II toxin-antitoxin system RelB/DinJ family antitoxin [Coriobacteriia bacterium]|nr:type II toxin-antitoxin system RelB/DinJ family antitoxin [Coriobacteriia bacterium]